MTIRAVCCPWCGEPFHLAHTTARRAVYACPWCDRPVCCLITGMSWESADIYVCRPHNGWHSLQVVRPPPQPPRPSPTECSEGSIGA